MATVLGRLGPTVEPTTWEGLILSCTAVLHNQSQQFMHSYEARRLINPLLTVKTPSDIITGAFGSYPATWRSSFLFQGFDGRKSPLQGLIQKRTDAMT